MTLPLRDIGADSVEELVALVADDTNLKSSVVDPLRELVWRSMRANLTFFLEQFWNVETIRKGYALFKLRDYQRSEAEVFEAACRADRAREIRLKARQVGFTTLDSGGAFWSAYFHPYHPWLLASQGEDDAKATLLKKIKTPFLMLPNWVLERGPTRTTDNSETLSFDNGSEILSVPSTPSAGRGKSMFGVLLDEFAYAEYAQELQTAVDPMCYGPMFVFSTANGMGNPFHRTWVESTRPDSEWNRLSRAMRKDEPWFGAFVPWHSVPDRSPEWYAREKRKFRGKESDFYQEHPSTPEEAFAKTGRPAIAMGLLREQPIEEPYWKYDVSLLNLESGGALTPNALLSADAEERDHELWVWAHPEIEKGEDGRMLRAPNYVMSVDTAEGLEHGDRTSVVIADANNREVVATLRSHYPIEDLHELLLFLADAYYEPLIGPERNNHGILPIEGLRRANYPRLYRASSFATAGGGRSNRYGFMTTRATKPKMVQDFNAALKNETLTVHDPRLLEEAQVFVADGKGGYGASKGNNDDHVIGHMICLQLMDDVGEYPITWRHRGPKALTWGDITPPLVAVQKRASSLASSQWSARPDVAAQTRSFLP